MVSTALVLLSGAEVEIAGKESCLNYASTGHPPDYSFCINTMSRDICQCSARMDGRTGQSVTGMIQLQCFECHHIRGMLWQWGGQES